MNEIKINKTKIGDKNPCYIVCEAGPTHQGLESAMRLSLNAKKAGANAIKFQILNSTHLVADPLLEFTYEVLEDIKTEKRRTVTEPLRDILVRRDMSRDEWSKLKKYCDSIDLEFFATACFKEDVDFLIKLGCKSIKIASSDINHISFIRYVAKTGVCIQLDTGGSTLTEMQVAVDAIRSEGNNNIIIHHCPSGYPANTKNVNLKMIQEIKRLFNCVVGYSDHSTGWNMDVAALALGANLIEKTITEDRTIQYVEHIMSLDPEETINFVKSIKEVEQAMGSTNKVLSASDIKKRNFSRRGIYLSQDLPANHVIKESDIDFRRPGYGIAPDKIKDILSSTLKHKKKAGEILEWNDLKKK
jgi:N,N'-diacetyllegionaminate synthase